MLVAAVCLWGIVKPVQGDASREIGYESLLFDTSRIHTIDITADDWDAVIANAAAEEYRECNVVIDGENLGLVGIRAKGNTSLSSVATLGSERYSFKVEFNHYVKGKKYHGLDKLSLNNLIQDATLMKDYLAYTLMGKMGVPAPLCSYVQINVNGEPWGLYLAVEGVEDAFLERNSMTKGELYKPDSMSFGGGRGNGGDFDIEKFREKEDDAETTEAGAAEDAGQAETQASGTAGNSFGGGSFTAAGNPFGAGDNPFGGGTFSPPEGTDGSMPEGMPQMPGGGFTFPGSTESGEVSADQAAGFPQPGGGDFGGGFGGFNFGMGSNDVKLVYTDDDPESYSNIFNNAKTNVSSRDKARLIASLKKLNEGADLDSVVNKDEVTTYLAVHNFLCNDDSYTGMMVHNYYLYEENGKLTILPWDYNLGFGGFSAAQDATSTVNSPIDSPVSGGTTDSRPLISWIFGDEEALAAYHETYSRFISECVESGWLESEIDRVQAMIISAMESDPTAFYTREECENAVSTLKTFCAKRAESVRGQLEGTIPSTSQGQREDSSSLVDASEISTADMGKMDNGNNPGGGNGGGPAMPGGSMPDFSGGSFTMPGGQDGGSMPDFSGGSFTLPGGRDSGGFSPAGFQGGSFTPPSGSFPGGTGAASDNAGAEVTAESAGSTAATEETQVATEKTQAAPEEAQAGGRPEPPGGMPEGFPGMDGFQGGTNHSDAWIHTGICFAVLLAAILVIRKVGAHNR